MLENLVIQCTYFEYYIQCKDEDANKISVISAAAIYNKSTDNVTKKA